MLKFSVLRLIVLLAAACTVGAGLWLHKSAQHGSADTAALSAFCRAVDSYEARTALAAQHWNTNIAGRPVERLSDEVRRQYQLMVVMADAVVIPAPRGSPPANQLFAALGRFHQALLLQEVSLENDDSVAIESAQDAKQEAGAEIAAILPLACPPAALKA